ncbi:hypothetical protein J3Q64DRAFT_1767908 [Phycomyces blakesleeanus]|uniref:J domain-containing protein n=1 Tax=Phycomyces blakesleeanus TaxID=4837 RepID=A0ABR3AM32_PHYBL
MAEPATVINESSTSGTRQRPRAGSQSVKTSSDNKYTPEQAMAVKEILACGTEVLSDPRKKAIHDSSGGDPEQRGNAGASFASAFSNARGFQRGGMGEEISPEDLFNTFFNGGFGESFGGPGFSSATFVGPGFRTQTFYTGGGAGGRTTQTFAQQTTYPWWTSLIQLLPLIILVGYAFISGLFNASER